MNDAMDGATDGPAADAAPPASSPSASSPPASPQPTSPPPASPPPSPPAGGRLPERIDLQDLEEGPLVVRPSLLAAFDVAARLAFLVVAAALPLLLGLAFSGELRVFLAGVATAIVGGTTGLVYGAMAALAPLVQLAFTRYIIEPDGIRVRTQVLAKTERRVQWEKVTMLQHRRSVVDRVFGLDRLDVIAYGARGTTLHLVGLRQAAGLRDLVARRMREHASVGGRFGDD